MIRQCESAELKKIYEVINEAAATYKGVIPADCWKEPYMSEQELQLPHFFRRSGFYLKAFTGEQDSRSRMHNGGKKWHKH